MSTHCLSNVFSNVQQLETAVSNGVFLAGDEVKYSSVLCSRSCQSFFLLIVKLWVRVFFQVDCGIFFWEALQKQPEIEVETKCGVQDENGSAMS